MTLVAGSSLPGVSDIDGVSEIQPLLKIRDLGTLLISLRDNNVAGTTVIAYDRAIITPMSAIVASHAALENMVPYVTGVI